MTNIHKTAIVSNNAVIGKNVQLELTPVIGTMLKLQMIIIYIHPYALMEEQILARKMNFFHSVQLDQYHKI